MSWNLEHGEILSEVIVLSQYTNCRAKYQKKGKKRLSSLPPRQHVSRYTNPLVFIHFYLNLNEQVPAKVKT